MAVPDNFTAGKDWTTEQGLKTGAELNDTVTQAVLVANDAGANRLYDNVFIDLDASAPPRLQVKAGSIDNTRLAAGAALANLGGSIDPDLLDGLGGFDRLVLVSTVGTSPGWVVDHAGNWVTTINSAGNLANMLDNDPTTFTDEGRVDANDSDFFYYDFGAVKTGIVRVVSQVIRNSGATFTASLLQAYDNIFWFDTSATSPSSNSAAGSAAQPDVTFKYVTHMGYFTSRFIGMKLKLAGGGGKNGSIKVATFDVFARAFPDFL